MENENSTQAPGRDDPPVHKPTGFPKDGEGRRKPDTSDDGPGNAG